MRFGIAGAGFSGAVVARRLADAGHHVTIHERRRHVAGNCHTERHRLYGVMLHRYGPHIFHTSNQRVWDYVNEHADMVPFRLEVRTEVDGRVYPLPISLATINQVFATAMNPTEARQFIAEQVVPHPDPVTFEQAALATVGPTLYRLFFEGYTTKQWGRHPSKIPASVFRRLPVRFNYDSSYFDHRWQAIPRDGYTALCQSILDHPNVTTRLSDPYPTDASYDWTIWTGPLDAYHQHRFGRLSYRTLRFVDVAHVGDYQGAPIMNYGDVNIPWTRITEHAHFAPWEQHTNTVASVEYSRQAQPGDDPYYPIRGDADLQLLARYRNEPADRTTFVGRLGTYRYLDMDVTIAEALTAADRILEAIDDGRPIPTFTNEEK